jgi:hypothetical protein
MYEEHFHGAGPCVLAFSSSPHRFEWGATLRRMGVPHVLFKDTHDKFWQHGIPGMGLRHHVVEYIRNLTVTMRKTVTLGLSAGSYGALMYGHAAGVEQVIAISPVTGAGPLPDFEPEWHPRINGRPEIGPILNLKSAYANPAQTETGEPLNFPRVELFASNGSGAELDLRMAQRLGVSGVRYMPGHSHVGLARHMRDTGYIERLVRDTNMQDFEEHLIPNRKNVYVAFAGGSQDFFQFGKVFRELGVSHVLFRDSTQHYYLNGVRGIGDTRDVLHYLHLLKIHHHVTTVGVSSGAYGALYYGQRSPVHRIVAISPLTGREVDDFAPHWHSRIIDPDAAFLDDLRKYFPNGPIPQVDAYVSNGEATELDHQMCTRLKIREDRITMVPGYSHGKLAAGMRDTGMFAGIFK